MAAITFWARVRRFPPILCRLLAKHTTGRPLSITEIADHAGLSVLTVASLEQQTDWRGVDIETMRRFTQACGTDFTNTKDMNRVMTYLSRAPSFRHLKSDPQWSSHFIPLIRRWMDSVKPRHEPQEQ